MKEILGNAKNIRSLLSGAKFAIDYYQREYRWEKKHVSELIDDLSEKFLDSHQEGNERSAIEHYNRYFLGSIIISDRDGKKYIIDGQQRLTTITLLLIYIYHHLSDDFQKTQLADLIFSQKYGQRSFNLDVDERNEVMEALFTKKNFEENGQSESIVNILHRYHDIEDLFPEELSNDTLPYFADWLIENVYMVEITTYSDTDAYTIFETMNDRGLSLTPTEMLKGYLLSKITDINNRYNAGDTWQNKVSKLKEIGKDEDADAIKTWLRSQYAETIRERKRNAVPQDFDLIGTEFHRWVKDNEEKLKLEKSKDYYYFIKSNFSFYTDWYLKIRQASEDLIKGFEEIFYNAQYNFTLQYPVLLAPLKIDDNDIDCHKKLKIVSSYLDILINRRIWNWHSIDYSTMQYTMFNLIREIRGKNPHKLAELLFDRLISDEETFKSNERFYLHGMNGRLVHLLLARITDCIEINSGRQSRYKEYIQRGGKNGYEIEHIWADHFEEHSDEFSHPADFKDYRNRIGGLLLLPKSFNASYGDLPYEQKKKYYAIKQNLLAQSLCKETYEHDPGFNKFVSESKLPFKSYETFKKSDLDERQNLYINLAEQIWNPENIKKILISN
ncbi:MAG TPA: DUF262 domain-containing protein [Bacteroidales bacterium]|jgi:uncharacterized protein with ParB-like and HNH nuclease domain|nr:DUF262 domain-containing protein [Bacteroidales bacterium]HQI63386.1 DUF262 domain-containing protein [Bacteroidales bacterium]